MPSECLVIDRDALMADLDQRVFTDPHPEEELFGLELELIPFTGWASGETPRHVPIRSDGLESLPVVKEVANALALGVKTPEGDTFGNAQAGRFTFEPGGQVEFSGGPERSPAACFHQTAATVDQLRRTAFKSGIHFLTTGANPWLDVDTLGLNTRAPRYRTMDQVYASIGRYGRRMMRQTATVHVNVDLGGPDTAWRRWQAAQLLAPIAHATFAYSPAIDGKRTPYASYRGRVWTETDPSRCGFPPGFLADPGGNPVDHYFDFAYSARVLMLPVRGQPVALTTPLPFGQWLEDGAQETFPNLEDWQNHLTTLFPEVRPRGFLELRSADAQARAFWSVPLTWWSALLCDDTTLDLVLAKLSGNAGTLPSQFGNAARFGAESQMLGELVRWCFERAAALVASAPDTRFSAEMRRAFEVFGNECARRGKSPAHRLLEKVERYGLTPEAYDAIESHWGRLVDSERAAGDG